MSLLAKLAQLKEKTKVPIREVGKRLAKMRKRKHDSRQLMLPFPDGPAFEETDAQEG